MRAVAAMLCATTVVACTTTSQRWSVVMIERPYRVVPGSAHEPGTCAQYAHDGVCIDQVERAQQVREAPCSAIRSSTIERVISCYEQEDRQATSGSIALVLLIPIALVAGLVFVYTRPRG